MTPRFLTLLWAYRYFLARSVWDDYRRRFARSKVALLWTIIHPLVQVTVFALIFSTMLGGRLPGNTGKFAFAIYMLSAICAWGVFSDAATRLTTVFVEYGSQIRKIGMPRILPVGIALGVTAMNFVVLLAIILAFLIVTGNGPSVHLLGLIPPLLVALLLGSGIGLIMGTLHVFMRDVGQVLTVAMTFWFWFTPCIYQLTSVPAEVRPYIEANPMTPVVVAFQTVMLTEQWPHFSTLLTPAVIALVLCMLGAFMVIRSQREMADAL